MGAFDRIIRIGRDARCLSGCGVVGLYPLRRKIPGSEEKYGERILSFPNENPFSSLEFLN